MGALLLLRKLLLHRLLLLLRWHQPGRGQTIPPTPSSSSGSSVAHTTFTSRLLQRDMQFQMHESMRDRDCKGCIPRQRVVVGRPRTAARHCCRMLGDLEGSTARCLSRIRAGKDLDSHQKHCLNNQTMPRSELCSNGSRCRCSMQQQHLCLHSSQQRPQSAESCFRAVDPPTLHNCDSKCSTAHSHPNTAPRLTATCCHHRDTMCFRHKARHLCCRCRHWRLTHTINSILRQPSLDVVFQRLLSSMLMLTACRAARSACHQQRHTSTIPFSHNTECNLSLTAGRQTRTVPGMN